MKPELGSEGIEPDLQGEKDEKEQQDFGWRRFGVAADGLQALRAREQPKQARS